jgi:hypothetical protein
VEGVDHLTSIDLAIAVPVVAVVQVEAREDGLQIFHRLHGQIGERSLMFRIVLKVHLTQMITNGSGVAPHILEQQDATRRIVVEGGFILFTRLIEQFDLVANLGFFQGQHCLLN